MEQTPQLLPGATDQQKSAYLTVIASIATADTEASGTEIEYLTDLTEAAGLSGEHQQRVMNAAKSTDEQQLLQSLDVLKGTELRYSLITDLLAFAKADQNYSESEEQGIRKIADYLGVDEEQYNALGEVADQSASANPETVAQDPQSMLGIGELQDKLKGMGINGGSLVKGLLAVAAPLILSKIMGRRSGAGASRGGGIGDVLGGMMGGSGGGLGGMMGGSGGGLGSLIGMLSGGRGMGGLGGLVGKMFK